MMASTDLLSKIRRELDSRLRELRPLLNEYERLLVAADALASAGEGTVSAPVRAAPLRRRGSPLGRLRSTTTGTPTGAGGALLSEPTVEERFTNALGTKKRGPIGPGASQSRPKAERAQRGVAARAILAALEHGSHTASELLLVTAMSGPTIRNNLRRLQQAGTITPIKRDGDGRAAYALASTPS